jgi:antitoxin component YwqK of YwqJK toxin-antitoxin module
LRKIYRPLFFLLLLFPGILAGTQEPDLSGEAEEMGVEAPAFVEDEPEEPLPEPRWFRSNAAGMTLEEVPSRLAALRNEYALGIDYIPPGGLPAILASRYEKPWRAEVHILYRGGSESRRQWIFRDSGGTARLVAVFNQDLLNPPEPEITPVAETEEPGGDEENPEADETGEAEFAGAPAEEGEAAAGETEGEPPAREAGAESESGPVLTGFIEMYNEDGQISAEHLFQEGGEEAITRFVYRNRRLIRAELRRKTRQEEGERISPVYTDFYRYSRSASLRAVERVYHEGAETPSPVRLRFPHMVLDAAADKDFISPNALYAADFPEDVFLGEGYRIVYTTDERGRVLTETRQDDEGNVLGELKNTWSGERLSSISLKTGDEERLTEYGYNNDGDRIIERNYRNGTLERVVRVEGGREIEELYMNGAVILRAIWEDGRKISEERVRPKQ